MSNQKCTIHNFRRSKAQFKNRDQNHKIEKVRGSNCKKKEKKQKSSNRES